MRQMTLRETLARMTARLADLECDGGYETFDSAHELLLTINQLKGDMNSIEGQIANEGAGAPGHWG